MTHDSYFNRNARLFVVSKVVFTVHDPSFVINNPRTIFRHLASTRRSRILAGATPSRGCILRGMRRRGAGRGHAPIEEDSSSAPDDAGDAPWARHVGPYPISSFALDHALPERGLDAALRGREAEFRAFDGNLQAPTIWRFLCAGLVAAAARLANPLLRYDTKFCLLYTSPSPRDRTRSRMPSSA